MGFVKNVTTGTAEFLTGNTTGRSYGAKDREGSPSTTNRLPLWGSLGWGKFSFLPKGRPEGT